MLERCSVEKQLLRYSENITNNSTFWKIDHIPIIETENLAV